MFLNGEVYFVDADCYSRMTRVQEVLEHPGTIIRHHKFENYPDGIIPHTTAPVDYLIAGLKKVLDFGAWILDLGMIRSIDLAGAIFSPLLGVLTGVFLWFWFRQLQLPYSGMGLTLYAISPILIHGTILGRPDHQSLLILCMTVALGSEWIITRKPARSWNIVSGAGFGLGIWVSLYEPMLLLIAVVLLYIIFKPGNLWMRERIPFYTTLISILLFALILEGWRLTLPDETMVLYFQNWKKSIGELASLSPFSQVLFQWVGFSFVITPVLLVARCSKDKRLAPLLLLLVLTYGLTLYQVRWGYFFALIFAMSLPLQMAIIRKPFFAWFLFICSLCPVLKELENGMYPSGIRLEQIVEKSSDSILLRGSAEYLKAHEISAPILAPWWISPALVYWSGQPAVSGSSHESLPGTIDSARFYITENAEEARLILEKRKVKWVVAYEPSRVLETSAILLNRNHSEKSLAAVIYQSPDRAPAFLELAYTNDAFKIFRVRLP